MAALLSEDAILKYLQKKQSEAPKDLSEEWQKLEDLYCKRLWHQLTLNLLELIKDARFQEDIVETYQKCIQNFENKINQYSLVEICAVLVDQIKDLDEAVAFLEKLETKVKGNETAIALCKVLIGQNKLNKHCTLKSDKPKELANLESIKKLVQEVEEILEGMHGVTPVHARYYLLASGYFMLDGNHAKYYRAALRYLGCVELENISQAERVHHAYCLSLAALIGKGIYNFGELLTHPVINDLKNTDKAWVVDLLWAFNSGSITKFEELKKNWSQVPDLNAKVEQLKEKITLLCIMEMAFKKPALDRQISFKEISKEAHIPEKSVEKWVMKAIAQGLIRVKIDQVDRKVELNWVQPRVLDKKQVANMIGRLDLWCKDIQQGEKLFEDNAHDILTA